MLKYIQSTDRAQQSEMQIFGLQLHFQLRFLGYVTAACCLIISNLGTDAVKSLKPVLDAQWDHSDPKHTAQYEEPEAIYNQYPEVYSSLPLFV